MTVNRLRHTARIGLAAVLLASGGVVSVPFVPVSGGGPIAVASRDILVSLDRESVVSLPFAATHVALHWPGAPGAAVAVAFSKDGRAFGNAIPVELDELSDRARSSETYGRVIGADGAMFVRLTADRALPDVTMVVLDSGAQGLAATAGPATVSAASLQPAVISRAAWGATESLRFDQYGLEIWPRVFQPVQKIVIHHTAGPNDDPNSAATVRSIMRYDAITKGWSDIGYNFLIDSAGRIYEGRMSRPYGPGEIPTSEDTAGKLVTGAHAFEFNSGVLGIAMMGTFTDQDITPAARASLEALIAWESERHGIDPVGSSTYVNPITGASRTFANIAGHRDLSPTSCPGGVFYATLPALRSAVAGRIAAATGVGVDIKPPAVTAIVPTTISPTMSRSLSFGIVFDEPVTDLSPADLSITGSSLGWNLASLTGSAAIYSATLTANAPTNGTVGLSIAPGSVLDLTGNPGPVQQVGSPEIAWVADLAGTVTRIGGPDRYATAAAISAAKFAPGVAVAYIATGVDFPDALSGAVAAALAPGPILLVSGATIPTAVATELTRLVPGRIVILGGPGVAPSSVEAALASYTSGTVTRIAGRDRYATAAAISAATFAPGVPVAYIATGANFPDALGGAVAAALGPGPMILVPEAGIPTEVALELARLAPGRIVILGGRSVVSVGVETTLRGLTSGAVTRIAGPDRYGTAAAISTATFPPGVAVVYIATGDDFPDALSGAAVAALGPGPVLLVPGGTIPQEVAAELGRLGPSRIVILGGTSVVTDGVQGALAAYLRP